MKLILTILFSLFWVCSMAQFPNTHSQSNPKTREVFSGAINPIKGLINGRYADTSTANADYISAYPGAQIAVGNDIYHRDSTATRWILGASGASSASSITILNDSSISICNSNGCDTFKFTNIIVNNFTVLNDSTILVCDGNNTCDTLFVTPQPFNKTYVDSTKIVHGDIVDTLFYYVNGGKYIGGYIANSQIQNGLIKPGVVSWSGTGLIFDITSALYAKNGVIYTIPSGQVTLSPSDPDNSRIDLIAADTVSNSFVAITGVAGAVPIMPQADPLSQIALTTGILLNAGDTIPSGINSVMIYDENNAPPEWAVTSQGTITYDKDNTAMPYSGIRDILVSSFDSTYSSLIFTGASQSVETGKILKFRIKLTDTLPANASIAIWLYNGYQYVSFTGGFRNGYGFRADNVVNYQNVSIPFSGLPAFADSTFNKVYIEFKTTAINNNNLYIDRVELQDGIVNIPPQIDYSNKVDSMSISGGNIYYWVKGVAVLVGSVGSGNGIDSTAYHSLVQAPDSSYYGIKDLQDRVDTIVVIAGGGSGGGSGSGVQSVVAGDNITVDNTDPSNPIVSAVINTYTASSGVVLQGNNFKIQDTLDGAGTKLIWMPAKNAFRAGYASGTQWDVGSIGNYSAAFGYGSTASGYISFAANGLTTASGQQSAAFGASTASGIYSFSSGTGAALASGVGSATFGNGQALSDYSFAANTGTTRGAYSASFGNATYAKAYSGFVVGSWNDTTNVVSSDTFNVLNPVFQIGIGQSGGIGAKNALTTLFNGKITLNQYGSGTFTGTLAKSLGVDASGNIIEYDASGGGGSGISAYDSTITATSSQTDFTFSSFPTTASYISVFINSCAIDDSYYAYDAATQTLTFTSGTVDGDKIRLHIIE